MVTTLAVGNDKVTQMPEYQTSAMESSRALGWAFDNQEGGAYRNNEGW